MSAAPLPAAATLLDAWEHALPLAPGQRGLVLLALAAPDAAPEVLRSWSAGQRDAALLELRARLFGPVLEVLAACPHCQEVAEVSLPIDELLASMAPPPAAATAAGSGEPGDGVPAPGGGTVEPVVVRAGGYVVACRLPTVGDLADLAEQAAHHPDGGVAWLLGRCLRSCQPPPVDGAAALPAAVVAAVAEALAAADPGAELTLDLRCPSCGGSWQAPLDPVSHLWQELDAWAERQLYEVHVLARAYGWREADVLALGPLRRRRYLELCS